MKVLRIGRWIIHHGPRYVYLYFNNTDGAHPRFLPKLLWLGTHTRLQAAAILCSFGRAYV